MQQRICSDRKVMSHFSKTKQVTACGIATTSFYRSLSFSRYPARDLPVCPTCLSYVNIHHPFQQPLSNSHGQHRDQSPRPARKVASPHPVPSTVNKNAPIQPCPNPHPPKSLLTRCTICGANIRSDNLQQHLSYVHSKSNFPTAEEQAKAWPQAAEKIRQLADRHEQEQLQAKRNALHAARLRHLEEKRKTSSQPLSEEEVKRRNFAYEASAEFVTESFKTLNTQRHNHDDINLPQQRQRYYTQLKRENLEHELADLKKQEEQERKQQCAALVTRKKVQGLAEVVVGCIVTLLVVEDDEQIRYYITSAQKHKVHGEWVYVESDTPPLGADKCLRADCALGKNLLSKFVQDEVEVLAPGGTFTYRILSVQDVQAQNPVKSPDKLRKPLQQTEDGQPHTAIGSETYNFVARDNGKFGSFSKHDDYGDESDAEGTDIDVWYTTDYS
jgi:transcription elongation GreA/GreB family factor